MPGQYVPDSVLKERPKESEDILEKPKPVGKPAGKPGVSFKSLKAYNTRGKRSEYSS